MPRIVSSHDSPITSLHLTPTADAVQLEEASKLETPFAPPAHPIRGAAALTGGGRTEERSVHAVLHGTRSHHASGVALEKIGRKQAEAMLAKAAPLSSRALSDLLLSAKATLKEAASGQVEDFRQLAQSYLLLSTAETEAFAVLDEAAAGELRAKRADNDGARETYRSIEDDARDLLAEVGQIYALRCKRFSALMLGEAEWPTRLEPIRKGKAALFTNGFKNKAELDPAQRKAAYEEELHTFLSAGGTLEQLRILDERELDKLKVGERYEYVLLKDGRIRFATIPKKEDGVGPGHSVLAEGGYNYKDTKALAAGEFWVSRKPNGKLTAFCISAGSGHFKPFFDALSEADAPLEKMGIKEKRIIHYGGPANARKAARKLLEKAGLDKEEIKAFLPPTVPMRRLELHDLLR